MTSVPCFGRLRSSQLAVLVLYGLVSVVKGLLPPFFFTNQLCNLRLAASSTAVVGCASGGVRSSIITSLFMPSATLSKGGDTFTSERDSTRTDSAPVFPFVIEQVERGMQQDYKDISAMCIEVFFKEGTSTSASIKMNGSSESNNNSFFSRANTNGLGAASKSLKGDSREENSSTSNAGKNPFLGMNLAFLRNAQYGDLTTRKFAYPKGNAMFVAREVIPYKDSPRGRNRNSSYGNDVLPQKDTVYNVKELESFDQNGEPMAEYMTGEVIGFVEVTARQFALGKGDDYNETGRLKTRPILANLAVKKSARCSGVGSKLVQTCEEAVALEWDPSYREMLLQVEDDNGKAQAFYERRGYSVVFSDPASRTYDTSGFFPKQIRITKICMRKNLSTLAVQWSLGGGKQAGNGIAKMFQAFKDALDSRF
jgi:ribosomal protein S18 acetylase RimI-like enzyme